ncbi:recombinase family protein [Sinanaerobacter sp. ZZT-01]|uniref:recombinase family protein n=1 Tax=Sinanaerobacter sp. ZZT-01 TaxID=3111540 RepID=UPI002D76E6EE|nr:recombinase family protein [Sinanaerobacter sp. ZZT-01]WRR94225.1 recombinase family protein [Sinanaerobacter sp. ZZT-01]
MKVAIYCRLSEEDRNKQLETDDSESIQNQKSMLIQYAMEQGWEIYNIYSDDDYAGSDRNRPEFNRLLDDAKKHKFDIVLCKTQSRFTRELELVEKYIHGLFPLWGIRFVSIVDNADTANKGNKKSRQINGLVNEWYLEDMSENIRSVFTVKRKKGYHIGSFALYGYKKDPDQKGHLMIDEEAAEVVREVFTLFSQGYGKTAIARLLNDRGIPNPTEYKRLHGLRYQQPKNQNSTLWKYFAIADMLENEIYIGNMVQGKYGSVSYKTKRNKPRPKEQWYRVEGTHEAIIERALWDRVQALLKQKAKPFLIGKIGLFARKARCMYCGYTMRSTKNHDRHYLKCSSRHVAKDACIGSFISVDRLEKAVIAELNQLSKEYLDKDELERKVEFNHNLNEKKAKLEKESENYKKKIAEYIKGTKELYLDKVKGVISESDYIEFSKEFSNDKERLEKLIADSEYKIAVIESKLKVGDNRRQLIERYTNLEKLDRETVEKLIDYILVGKRDPKTKQVPIEIHWNF